MNPRQILGLISPPIIAQSYLYLNRHVRNVPSSPHHDLLGDYRSWDAALRESTGYNALTILEKTREALLKVKRGDAVYERDSVLFDEIQYAWAMLAGMLWVAAQSGGRLNVLDFGGSLGSSFFQNRRFLRKLAEVRWNVIEQPPHVAVGKADFEDEQLKFYGRVEDCLAETTPNLILCSAVLEYLEKPYQALEQLLDLPCNYFILDRTPFWDGERDRLCVQRVPPSIYDASYPSWILSQRRFHSFLSDRGWEIVAEFDDPDRLNGPVEFAYRGMILARRDLRESK